VWAARARAKIEFGPTGYEGERFAGGWMPPPDHRRCSHIKKDGERCKKWCPAGARTCVRHSGKQNSYVARALRAENNKNTPLIARGAPRDVMGFYKNNLSKTLQEKLAECLEQDESEQTELLEELALVKNTVLDVAKLYDVAQHAEAQALQGCLAAETQEARTRAEAARSTAQEYVITTGQLLRDGIKDVADLCDKIEKHRALRREQTGISVHAVAYLAKEFTRQIYQVCGDNLEMARQFELATRNIRLPDSRAELVGTLITPDQDVLSMDATVPGVSPEGPGDDD